MAEMLKFLLEFCLDFLEGNDAIFFWGMDIAKLDSLCGCHDERTDSVV